MKMLRILEISWLILSLVGLCLFVFNLFSEGLSSAFLPLIFSLIAFSLFIVRRKQRMSYEKNQTLPPPDAE
jgi:hypothetical protein